MPSMMLMLAKRTSCSTSLRKVSNSILRRAASARTGMPPTRADDHRNTLEVPCSPPTLASTLCRATLASVQEKEQAVEIGAGIDDAVVAGELTGHVGQRLGRIGGDHDHCAG